MYASAVIYQDNCILRRGLERKIDCDFRVANIKNLYRIVDYSPNVISHDHPFVKLRLRFFRRTEEPLIAHQNRQNA